MIYLGILGAVAILLVLPAVVEALVEVTAALLAIGLVALIGAGIGTAAVLGLMFATEVVAARFLLVPAAIGGALVAVRLYWSDTPASDVHARPTRDGSTTAPGAALEETSAQPSGGSDTSGAVWGAVALSFIEAGAIAYAVRMPEWSAALAASVVAMTLALVLSRAQSNLREAVIQLREQHSTRLDAAARVRLWERELASRIERMERIAREGVPPAPPAKRSKRSGFDSAIDGFASALTKGVKTAGQLGALALVFTGSPHTGHALGHIAEKIEPPAPRSPVNTTMRPPLQEAEFSVANARAGLETARTVHTGALEEQKRQRRFCRHSRSCVAVLAHPFWIACLTASSSTLAFLLSVAIAR